MAEEFYSWLQDLACYFILLSAVMNFLPDNSYKKYVQYYMGLLLILVVLAPVFDVTHIQDKIDSYIEEFGNIDTGREEWEEKSKQWEGEWQENIRTNGEEVDP